MKGSDRGKVKVLTLLLSNLNVKEYSGTGQGALWRCLNRLFVIIDVDFVKDTTESLLRLLLFSLDRGGDAVVEYLHTFITGSQLVRALDVVASLLILLEVIEGRGTTEESLGILLLVVSVQYILHLDRITQEIGEESAIRLEYLRQMHLHLQLPVPAGASRPY